MAGERQAILDEMRARADNLGRRLFGINDDGRGGVIVGGSNRTTYYWSIPFSEITALSIEGEGIPWTHLPRR